MKNATLLLLITFSLLTGSDALADPDEIVLPTGINLGINTIDS